MNRHLFRSHIKTPGSDSSARRSELTADPHPDEDAATTLKLLNQALRIAHLTVLRCKRQYRIALRHHSPPLAAAALEHANDAKLHADRIAERIDQLGGKPDPAPDALPHRSRIDPQKSDPAIVVIGEHLTASRAAVESYTEIATFFAAFDPVTQKLMEEIGANEQERGDDLARLRGEMTGPSSEDRVHATFVE